MRAAWSGTPELFRLVKEGGVVVNKLLAKPSHHVAVNGGLNSALSHPRALQFYARKACLITTVTDHREFLQFDRYVQTILS